MSAQQFGAWLAENGHVPEGLSIPADSGLGPVRDAVRPRTGSLEDPALALWAQLDGLYDRFCAESGTPRVAVIRARPMSENNRRALAGVLREVL